MAIKPLEKRLDQMSGVAQVGVEMDPIKESLPPPIDAPQSLEELPEPIQVAGKRGMAIGIIKELTKETPPAETQPIKRIEKKTKEEKILEAPSGNDPEIKSPVVQQESPRATASEVNAISGQQPVRVIGNTIVSEPIPQSEVRRFFDVVESAPAEGKPPRVRPNLNFINSEDGIKKFLSGSVQYHKNYIDQQRRAGRSFEQIESESMGISQEDAFRMALARKAGDRPFTDAESLAVRNAQLDLAVETKEAVELAIRSGTDDDLARAGMLIQIQGYAEAAYLGNVADYGRGLAINKIVIAPDAERSMAMRQIIEQTGILPPPQSNIPGAVENITDVPSGAEVTGVMTDSQKFLEAMGGKDKVRFATQLYQALPGTAQKQTFVRRMLSLGRAGLDSAAEIFQSAIVSGPQTHAFNFFGTPIHVSMMLSERYLAAMIRGDSAAKDAVLYGVRVIPKYLNQSLSAAWEAAKTEIPADMTSKFEQSRIATKAENFGVAPDTMLGKTIDYLGIATRAPGFRVLTTVDEGYKALLRGMEMEMISAEISGKAFNSALDSGKSIEDATNAARDVYLRTIEADSTFAQASEFARIGTFQDNLPGAFLSQAQTFFSHPVAKLMGFPFFKTPMQIALRIQERTPLALAMPRFWKAITNPANESERSVAIAKVGLSSAIGLSIMTTDYISGGNIKITGYGPTNPKERQNWLQTHQPYAVGVKNLDGSFKWVDYGRYDPISGIIAGWADVRDTVLKVDDPEVQEGMLLDISLATVNYMLENQPMVQFASELATIIKPQSNEERLDGSEQLERILQAFQKQSVSSGLIVGQSVGTFGLAPMGIMSNIERYVDPFKRSALPENQYEYLDLPGWRMSLRPVYEAVQLHRSKTPYFSSQMFVERNDWYEPIKQSFGDLTAFSPVRIQEKKYSAINKELDDLRSGFPRISNTLGESMIKLNDQQMERYKELVNYPSRSVYAMEIMGYSMEEIASMSPSKREAVTKELKNELPPLADALISLIADPNYRVGVDPDTMEERSATKGERLNKLVDTRKRYLNLAKKLMLAEFPELQKLIDQRKAYEDKNARKPPSLPLSEDVLESMQ